MKKSLLFPILLFHSILMIGQVGINNENPVADLDVTGSVLVREKLYLEDPGSFTNLATTKLLLIKDNGGIIKYDVEGSEFGPLNYAQFIFTNTNTRGLTGGFDTKISADKYTLVVQGFYFNDDGDTNVSLRKTTGSPTSNRERYMEGHQFYAYVEGTGVNRTWRIRAFVNNSSFYLSSASQIDLYMDVIIYRNNFITKIWGTPQTISLGSGTTGTAPLPAGF